jgi:hypothetical protein
LSHFSEKIFTDKISIFTEINTKKYNNY